MTTEIGAFIHALTEDSSPASNDEVMTYDITGTAVKKVQLSNLGGVAGGIPVDGWITGDAMTYAGADDPTYTLTISGDVSGTYGVGMRIKLTQATGGTKYFIITKVAVSGDTTLTLYGGTDYNLENEAISDPYYSPVKAPFGFPLDPDKWTVITTDTASRSQATPGAGTWYNLNSNAITIPIGCWRVKYHALIKITDSNSVGQTPAATLSTANNSESDKRFTCLGGITLSGSTIYVNTYYTACSREKPLALTSKTVYYLNEYSAIAADTLELRGDIDTTVIEAICAYL